MCIYYAEHSSRGAYWCHGYASGVSPITQSWTIPYAESTVRRPTTAPIRSVCI